MKRGIYLVANKKSQELCFNLIYSIRESGCNLPIRLIHFGGEKINSLYILKQVEFLYYEDFPLEAKQLITNLSSVLTDCPLGFLYRYLAWFSDWDEFIYSDNDIVALCNWETLFDHLSGFDVVHADEEYTTNGRYNYTKPEIIQLLFGINALESAITAGHIVVKRNSGMVNDINNAIVWFNQNSGIAKKHDQSLLHIASLLGDWRVLNLCKSPHNWLSSWAGDYKNSLQIIQHIQNKNVNISHLHYSGSSPKGDLAIQDLLLSAKNDDERLIKLSIVSLNFLSGYQKASGFFLKLRRFYNTRFSKRI